jgi:phosphoenolpyruvate synthase/pyruvate phosphate dikinase
MPDISEQTIEGIMEILVDDIDSFRIIIEEQEELIKNLIDHIEFLEEQQMNIENNDIKKLVEKNINLKKGLSLLENVLKCGVKN